MYPWHIDLAAAGPGNFPTPFILLPLATQLKYCIMVSVFFLVTQMTNKVWGASKDHWNGDLWFLPAASHSGLTLTNVMTQAISVLLLYLTQQMVYLSVLVTLWIMLQPPKMVFNSKSSWTGRGFEVLIWGRVEEDSGLLGYRNKSLTTWRKLSSTHCATVLEGSLF